MKKIYLTNEEAMLVQRISNTITDIVLNTMDINLSVVRTDKDYYKAICDMQKKQVAHIKTGGHVKVRKCGGSKISSYIVVFPKKVEVIVYFDALRSQFELGTEPNRIERNIIDVLHQYKVAK